MCDLASSAKAIPPGRYWDTYNLGIHSHCKWTILYALLVLHAAMLLTTITYPYDLTI